MSKPKLQLNPAPSRTRAACKLQGIPNILISEKPWDVNMCAKFELLTGKPPTPDLTKWWQQGTVDEYGKFTPTNEA